MKKNWTMRVGALMLALTLITSCFVSGTFAKYVTDGEGTDKARVANFGVVVTGEGDLFAQNYTGTKFDFTVESSNEDDVVAPGTTGGLVANTITGTPEVAVTISNTLTKFDLTGWTLADGTFYCPLKLTVGDTTYCGLDYASAAEFKAAVEAKVATYTVDVEANTDLSTINNNLGASWAWDFVDATGSVTNQTDINDTYLGDQAAAGNPSWVEIGITTTVTQID